FGKDPGRFYPNMTVKIGRFGKSDTDLKFQETVEGNLFYLLQEVPNQLKKLGLNERQIRAVLYVKEYGSINNSTYQKLNEMGKSVTTEELQELVDKEVFIQVGTKGRGSKYELVK